MKLQYFFGCILAAASLAVWPEIVLAHGGGGHGVDKEHSFARGFTLRLVGTFANDGDALRVAAGPLRRTHWFVALLIKLSAETFVCERRGNLPRSADFSDLFGS